jgi:SAM-dependent methyltransferase
MTKFTDEVNRGTMRSGSIVNFYAERNGLLLHERSALRQVAEEAANQPILDLGVGGGRTVKPLLKVSADYLGVDYSPEMIEACRKRFPQQRFAVADARDLSTIADGTVFLVSFGWSGLCMVDHDDRLKILREIYRVLRPGGVFLLTTYNQDSPVESAGFAFPEFNFRKRPDALLREIWRFSSDTMTRWRNWTRMRHRSVRHREYSMINDRSHDYSVMLYYITVESQRRQIEALGFEKNAAAFGEDGKPITSRYTGRDFAMLARKPR